MEISTADLVYINDAAKSLKQKEVLVVNNKVIGIDQINYLLIYTTLDPNLYKCLEEPFIINSRDLSSFIKTITMESSFEVFNSYINTISGGSLFINRDYKSITQIQQIVNNYFNITRSRFSSTDDIEIPDIATKIKSMNKSDGGVLFNFNNYLMTLAPSIIPMNKPDKLFIHVMDYYGNTFVAKFRINKKKSDVFVYMRFCKL